MRLILAPFTAADAPALCEVDHDPEHRRRFEFPDDFAPSIEHSAAVIAQWEVERRAGTLFPFAVRDGDTGELLGGCELGPLGGGVANLSYWTHPRHRGRGVASQAVRVLCERAFVEMGVRRIELAADADNAASRAVALRNGFREAGVRGGQVLYLLD